MKRRSLQRNILDLPVLMVFAVMALCVLLVLLTGARVYRNLTERSETLDARRTGTHYVTTRFRQSEGKAEVADFGGCTALTFREEVDGTVYLTRVYCHDGWLRELYAAEGGVFSPEDGEKILPLQDLSAFWDGNMLTVRMTYPDGTCRELWLFSEAEEVGS